MLGHALKKVTAGSAVAWLATSFLLLSPTAGRAGAQDFLNPRVGVAFNIPTGYRAIAISEETPLVCMGPDNGQFAPKIAFTQRRTASRVLASNAGSKIAQRMKMNVRDYQEVTRGRFMLNGREAVMVSGVYPAPDMPGVMLQNCTVATMRGNYALVFAFTTARDRFKTELPDFIRMMDTIRWNPKGLPRSPAPPLPEEGPTPIPNATPDVQAVTLTSEKIGFTKPEGWTRYNFRMKPSKGRGRVIYSAYGRFEAGKVPSNILLTVEAAPGVVFPDNMDAMVESEFGGDDDRSSMVSHERGTIAGMPSYSVVFDTVADKGGSEMRVRYVLIIRGRNLYTFAYLADKSRYEIDTQDFETLLGSIRWMK